MIKIVLVSLLAFSCSNPCTYVCDKYESVLMPTLVGKTHLLMPITSCVKGHYVQNPSVEKRCVMEGWEK